MGGIGVSLDSSPHSAKGMNALYLWRNTQDLIIGLRQVMYRFLRAALDVPTPEQHMWIRSDDFRGALGTTCNAFGVHASKGELAPVDWDDFQSRYFSSHEAGPTRVGLGILCVHVFGSMSAGKKRPFCRKKPQRGQVIWSGLFRGGVRPDERPIKEVRCCQEGEYAQNLVWLFLKPQTS